MSDSLWPPGLLPTRLFCPWDFPGKNTGAGFHFLLQGIFPTQGSNPHLPYWQAGSLLLSNQGSPSFNFCLIFWGLWSLQAFITHKSLSSKLQSERIHLGKQKDTLGHCSSALSFLSTSLLWGGNKDSSLNFRRNENDFSPGCGVTSPTSSVCCQLRFTCPYRFSGALLHQMLLLNVNLKAGIQKNDTQGSYIFFKKPRTEYTVKTHLSLLHVSFFFFSLFLVDEEKCRCLF